MEPTHPPALEGEIPTTRPPRKSLSQPLDHQGSLSPTVFTAVPRIPNPRVHLQLLISSEHLPPKSCSLPSSPNSLHAELNLRPLHPSYLLSGWPQTSGAPNQGSFLSPPSPFHPSADCQIYCHNTTETRPSAYPLQGQASIINCSLVPSRSPHSQLTPSAHPDTAAQRSQEQKSEAVSRCKAQLKLQVLTCA